MENSLPHGLKDAFFLLVLLEIRRAPPGLKGIREQRRDQLIVRVREAVDDVDDVEAVPAAAGGLLERAFHRRQVHVGHLHQLGAIRRSRPLVRRAAPRKGPDEAVARGPVVLRVVGDRRTHGGREVVDVDAPLEERRFGLPVDLRSRHLTRGDDGSRSAGPALSGSKGVDRSTEDAARRAFTSQPYLRHPKIPKRRNSADSPRCEWIK